MTGDEFIVPGDDLDINTGIVQHEERFMGSLLGRIDEGNKTMQGKVGLIVYSDRWIFRRGSFLKQRQGP